MIGNLKLWFGHTITLVSIIPNKMAFLVSK
jgi:hypothetical protein